MIFKPTASDATCSATEGTNSQLPLPTPLPHVWVRQRQDDTIFLLPEALAHTEDNAVATPRAINGNEGMFATIPQQGGASERDENDEEGAFLSWGNSYTDDANWGRAYGYAEEVRKALLLSMGIEGGRGGSESNFCALHPLASVVWLLFSLV